MHGHNFSQLTDGLITVRQYQHETKVHLEIGEGILRLASSPLHLECFEFFFSVWSVPVEPFYLLRAMWWCLV